MIQIIKNNKLYSNSLIFLIGSGLGGVAGYVYNFLMARMLGQVGYGELQSILALTSILGIPLATLSTVIIKYAASIGFGNEDKWAKLFYLLKSLTLKLLASGFVFFIVFLALSNFLAGFLKLTSVVPLIIIALAMVIAFLNTVNNGLLQGLQKFKELAVIGLASMAVKIMAGYFLVKFAFYVSGALGALVLSGIIGYILSWLPLRFLINYGKKSAQAVPVLAKLEMIKYSLPVFLTLFFTTLLINIDLILVKHFFDPADAGQYAALAVIGRIIFFVIGPLVAVMFPMSAAAHAHQGDHGKILKNSACIALIVGMIGLAIYFLLPDLIVKIIVGSQFLAIAPYLGWFGLAMLFYSLVYLISQYLLAINQTKFIWLLAGAGVLQLVLILIWHFLPLFQSPFLRIYFFLFQVLKILN